MRWECGTLTSKVEVKPGVTSFVENTNHGANPMDVSGTVVITYNNVQITGGALAAARCTVVDPEAADAVDMVSTKPLKFVSVTGATPKTTGLKFEPEVGDTFANIKLIQKPGQPNACPIAGTYPVKGTVTANATGATLSTSSESTSLTLGGSAATLTGTVTVSAGATPTPLALTTTTP